MASSKFGGFAANLAKGGPPTAGLGLLGALGALAYGVTQSVYTGNFIPIAHTILALALQSNKNGHET